MKPKAEWAIDSEAIRAQEIIVKYIVSNINLLNMDTLWTLWHVLFGVPIKPVPLYLFLTVETSSAVLSHCTTVKPQMDHRKCPY